MKQRQTISRDGISSNAKAIRWALLHLVTLFSLLLVGSPAQAATDYTFSPTGLLPPGCSINPSSTNSYTCGVLTLVVEDTITVGSSTPVTVTFTGAFTTAAGNLINTAGATNDLNIVTNGVLTLGENTRLNANVNSAGVITMGVKSTINGNVIGTAAINMSYGSTIDGNFTASTTTGVITLAEKSTIGGFIHTDAGAVTVGNLSTIGGGIATQAGVVTLTTNINVGGDISTDAGAITIGSGSSTCGNVFSTGAGIVTITTNIQVGGDVKTVAGAITIGIGSTVGGDVNPTGAGVVTLTDVLVGGKVETGAGAITLTNSRVRGTVVATGAGVVTLTDSVINDTTLIVPAASACSVELESLVSDHHFDEESWSGVAGEVIDSSGNDYHGVASKPMTNSTDGVVCNAADFTATGTSDYVSLNGLALNNLDDFSISIWGKLDSSRSGQQTIFSATSNSERYGNGVLMFFSNTKTLRFYFRDTIVATYEFTDAISDDEWHHYVWTRKGDQHCLFMDGVSKGCQSASPFYQGSISVASNGLIIGQEQDSVGGGFAASQDWEGLVDEAMIFSSELSPAKISSIYANQTAGKNYDGTSRACPTDLTPIAEYRFDEASWNGVAGEILDNSGNGYNAARINNNSTPEIASPALTGNPGTCGYASQDKGSIQVTGLPLDTTTIGVKTTVTFWMNWNGKNNVMPIGWDIHDIWMVSSSIGFNTGNSDVYGISSEGFKNVWRHVAVEFTNGSVTSNRMHIDGVEQVLTQRRNSPNNSRAFVDSELRIGGWSRDRNYDFRGLMDEVRVYQAALSTAQINTIMNEVHPCDTPVVHHYEIVHDGQGLTCEAESVTIKAHDVNYNLVAPSASNTITLSTSITNDGWTLKSGNGSFNAVTAEYTFDGIETQVEFGLSKTTATASPHINIGVTDGTSTDLNGDITEDTTLAFADTGFRFLVDNNSIDIPTQLSGKPSNTGYNTSNLSLQAIKTSTLTGACEAALVSTKDIELVAECIDPIACAGKKVVINSTPINTQEDVVTPSSYTPVSLDFGSLTNNTARFDLTYPDAGKIQLHARYNIPVDGSPSGVYMKGSSNSFVVRPFGFSIAVEDANNIQNPAAVDHNGSVFMSAGDIFTTNLTAVQWKTGQDSNNDGIPDDTDNITSNLFTANFGNEITPETADITHALYLPKPATLGDLSNNSFNFINGIASNSNMTYSEVGIISFTANLYDNTYLTANNISGNAPYVGRFTPENFALSVDKEGSFVSVCEGIDIDMPFAYSGQMSIVAPSKGVLRYLEQPEILITPKSKLGNHTKNYTGDFNKLTLSGVSRFMVDDGTGTLVLAPIEDTTQVGVNANKVRLTSNFDDGILTEGENENVGILSFQYNDLDNFFYLHEENSEIIPFTSDINLAIASIIDGDAVTAIDADGIGDTGTASDTVITLNPSGKEIRFGRAYLANSFGPETSDLPQPFFVQYLDAVDHYKNTVDDTCTAFDSSKITLTTIDFDKNKTGINTVSGHFFNSETKEIELLAPSDGSDGIRGDLGVKYDIYPWLEYHWDWNGTGPKLYDNPSAVATFGLFRGNDRVIFQREVFH
jgi:MSHA biogenesis protein MshQ